ncbi:unnamed protein product [Toxocara canis]|uniref:Zf-IS66 domain-containing protein n=1 Tax=Toxocara canis TaxID=6265 RepID=A0A183VDK5_TOXCA|nr:unnamed protein product [Toxocara canis]
MVNVQAPSKNRSMATAHAATQWRMSGRCLDLQIHPPLLPLGVAHATVCELCGYVNEEASADLAGRTSHLSRCGAFSGTIATALQYALSRY